MSKFKFKNLILVSLFGFLLFSSNITYAKQVVMNLNIDGKVTKYEAEEVFIKVDGTLVVTKEMPPIIINERTLVPAREMFETMGAKVDWNNELREVDVTFSNKKVNLKIGSNIAKVTIGQELKEVTMDVTASIINDKTMIPFRAVAENIGYNVDWDQATRSVIITSPNGLVGDDVYVELPDDKVTEGLEVNEDGIDASVDKVDWSLNVKNSFKETKIDKKKNDTCNVIDASLDLKDKDMIKVTIKLDGKVTNVIPSEMDYKLILDIDNAKRTIDEKIEYTDNEFVSQIRSSEHNENGIQTRCVLDLKAKKMPYSITLSSNRQEIYVEIYKTQITNVSYSEKNNVGTFKVKSNGPIEGYAKRLTDNDRIYIDLPNAISQYKNDTNLKTSYVKNIRSSSVDNVVRFVLDLNEQVNYECENISDNEIKITLKKPTYKNVTYKNNDGYKLLIPKENVSINIKNVSIEEDYMDGIYEINLGTNLDSEIGTGSFNINDSMLDDFEIYKENKKTKIKFNTDEHRIVAIDIDEDKTNYIISVMLPGKKYKEVLILDAGHGTGNEGTSDEKYTGYSSDTVNIYKEQDMTLAMANSALKYLENNSDIKVYLTRESNEKFNDYIENVKSDSRSSQLLNGRTYMKETLDSDMFLSIHVNAMGDPKYDRTLRKNIWETKVNGTEIWYNNKLNKTGDDYNGLSNEKFAKEMIDGFIDYSDGTYENNDGKESKYLETSSTLAVLKKGDMPSALIEVGYINNEIDHEKLIDKNYLKLAGESLAKTIIDIFDKYKLDRN